MAGGLVASAAAARIGQPDLAYILLGLGSICWLVLGSIILGRLILGPALPPPLLPTLAIEVAPAAVASLAWFALNGGQVDGVARLLGGYGLLMVIAQVRLLPVFLRLPFMPSTWWFTFSWAAVATATLHWLQQMQGAGSVALQCAVTAAVSVLVGGIAVRTLAALVRHELFPGRRPTTCLERGRMSVLAAQAKSASRSGLTCARTAYACSSGTSTTS